MGGFWFIIRGVGMGLGGEAAVDPAIVDIHLELRIQRSVALELPITRTVPVELRTRRTVDLSLGLQN